jgi:flagellin-like hook-associated protein FlgL
MSGITLTQGIRSVLASLQTTAAQLGTTQNRLASGKRVNSALDNPTAFFTAQSLSNHASGLSALVDNVGQAQQTLQEAGQGLTSLVRLVESAKSVAQQARQTPPPATGYGAIDQTGSADASETAGSVTGNVDTSGGGFAAVVDGLQIQAGATTYTVHQASAPASEGINAIIADINNTAGLGPGGAVKASLDGSGKFVTLTANSTDTSFNVLASSAATALGVAGQSGTSTNLLQAASGLSGTSLTVTANGGVPKTINFGSGGGQVSTFGELQAALSGSGVSVSLTPNGGAQNITLDVAATVGTQNSLSLSGSALGALGLSGGTTLGIATNPVSNRASLQDQYNDLLQQIDALARDSSYNGVNLLQGDNLNIQLNESGSSSYAINGVTYDAAGLGLSTLVGTEFQSNGTIDGIIAALNASLTTMRAQASAFGSSLSTLQIRQDFTKSTVNIDQTGADALVLADTNQEGANLLALQTRQSLSSTALSLAGQSDQAVLKLFQ